MNNQQIAEMFANGDTLAVEKYLTSEGAINSKHAVGHLAFLIPKKLNELGFNEDFQDNSSNRDIGSIASEVEFLNTLTNSPGVNKNRHNAAMRLVNKMNALIKKTNY